MSSPAPSVKPRSPWRFAIPVLVFIVVIAAWGVGWFFVRDLVDRNFNDWLTKEAQAGRAHACPDRGYSGFPFHIELTCTRPVFRWDAPEGQFNVRVERFKAVALIYRPEHVIVDLVSPLIVEPFEQPAISLAFERGQASYSQSNGVFQRFSLVLEKPVGTRAGTAVPDVVADGLELHLRRSAASARDFDVAAEARLLATGGARAEAGANISFAALVKNWPQEAVSERGGLVSAWARGGGAVQLSALRVQRGTGLMTANGNVGFSASGRPEGAVDSVLVDTAALFAGVTIPGVGEPGALLGPVLSFVGRPAEIEGKRGTRLVLRVDDGRIGLGAITLFRLGPVF
jgi:hypothetical protein